MKSEKRFVKDVRSPHGTRVMKTITCSRCGKQDTIAFVPKKGEQPVLCRDCAEETLGVTDENARRTEDKIEVCESCGKRFPFRPKKERFVSDKQKELQALMSQDTRTLCTECRAKAAAEKRATAKKPRGLHPIVVKRTKK